MSVSPTEQQVVDIVCRAQRVQGAQLGIPKIREFIKENEPKWVLSEKRLRDIRRKNNLVPAETNSSSSPDAPSTFVSSQKPNPSRPMKKLHLTYMIGGEDGPTVTFVDDIPAEYCKIDAPREATSKFITDVMDRREGQALMHWNSSCMYCDRPAQTLFAVPAVTLHAETPVVLASAQPLCSLSGPCGRRGYTILQAAMMDANSPLREPGASIYTMP